MERISCQWLDVEKHLNLNDAYANRGRMIMYDSRGGEAEEQRDEEGRKDRQ